jgi:hypothetical protein
MFTSQKTTRDVEKFQMGIDLHFDGDKRLLFFLKNQLDYSIWIRVFRTIVEMNTRRIPVTLVNPFDYLNLLDVYAPPEYLQTPKVNDRQAENL